MAYNNCPSRHGIQMNESANLDVIKALRHGPLYPSEIARRLGIPLPSLQQRLYRMRRVGRGSCGGRSSASRAARWRP